LRERITAVTGYYFTRDKGRSGWSTIHRPFAGGEFVLWNRGVEVEARSLVERFATNEEPDYTRFRHRLRLRPTSKTAPYLGVETFHGVDGWQKMRYSAGLRRTFAEEMIVDFGYFFEHGRPGISNRHMIFTSIHWRNKTGHIDPDL
jgi:hypothetical protein